MIANDNSAALPAPTVSQNETNKNKPFLIKRIDFDQFQDAAERLAQEHQPAGVRLELTGPWPAYDFTQI